MRALLFAGTASPVFVLQGIGLIQPTIKLAVALIVLGVMLFFVPLLLFPLAQARVGRSRETVVETKLATPNLGSFLLAYLLPLLSVALSVPAGWLAFVVLILIIVFVYVRGNLIHVQPAYWIFGWNAYDAKLESGEWCTILTKSYLVPGLLQTRNLGGHVHVLAR